MGGVGRGVDAEAWAVVWAGGVGAEAWAMVCPANGGPRAPRTQPSTHTQQHWSLRPRGRARERVCLGEPVTGGPGPGGCRYDFFIVSQAVRSGSVSPTHYNVIYDSSGLKPDHIQRLTYKLCHVYYNWPVSLRARLPQRAGASPCGRRPAAPA